MKLRWPFFILLFLSLSCTNQTTVDTNAEPCNCKLTADEMYRLHFPISCIGDSIVLCRANGVSGKSWVDFLQNKKLHETFKYIINCKTGEEIDTKLWSTSISYHNKAFIVYSNRALPAFDSVKHKWETGIVTDVYKETIYAENGVIKKSTPEMILTPPKYNAEAIDYVNQLYQNKKQSPHGGSVTDHLLIAAMNGDSLSRTRLLDLSKDFPHEKEYNDEAVNILIDFEKAFRNGKEIQYLDISQYGIFQH